VGARLLADENVPGPAVDALRRDGHDVAWMHEDAPGTRDPEVLARAQHESRVLITFDKDFGELAFRAGVAAAAGVVLFRIGAESPDVAARAAVGVFSMRSDWARIFAVVEDGRMRIRELPASSPGEEKS
jgi:predicted nuclease of predicted toxin-antitoxin system